MLSGAAAMASMTSDFTVVPTPGGQVPYALVGPDGEPVEPVQDYLTELLAADCSPLTLRSYAFDLLDWFRFLAASGGGWQHATRAHVRDWVLGLRSRPNPQRTGGERDRAAPGGGNLRTGKAPRRDSYAAATINYRLSVVAGFYQHQRRLGNGPATNPVPDDGPRGSRRNAHHNPMEPWTPGPRGSYRQKAERRLPRAIPDELYERVFAALTSNRDRAMVSLLVSSGARAAELLGMTGQDVDWGGQQVRLLGKGTRHAQWVAASPAFFLWLARYLAEQPPRPVAEPLWVTLRRPTRPLGYQALRAVLLRVNATLGTDLVLHDFRHTCAMRLAADPQVPLTDLQAHLRHRHLSTTETYLVARPEEVIRRIQAHQQAVPPAGSTATAPGWTYQPGDLDVLLGEPPR
jgi:integrase/recombinase XerD